MEIRYIDHQAFVVTGNAKREVVKTPSEFKQSERKEIEECRARIADLDQAASIIKDRLEAELIDGVDTGATRAELSAIGEEIHGFQRDIDHAAKRINEVDRLIDQQAATAIQQADAALLNAMTAPFDRIFKELA
jgi:hypothetical protein